MIALSAPWALLLLPLPVIAWVVLPASPERAAISTPASVAAMLTQVAGRGAGAALRPLGLVARVIGWCALVLALAGPHREEPPLLAPTGRDVIVALDLSASMSEADMALDGAKRPRIEIARDLLGRFMRGRRGDRIALIGFGTEAFLIAPLTFDVAAAAEMLDEVGIGLPGRRTDLGQPIALAVQMMRREPEGERMLILISDGETNVGALAALDAAALAVDLGLTIHVIGFAASIETEDAAHMTEIAAATGGRFFAATAADLMRDVYREIDDLAPTTPKVDAPSVIEDLRWAPLVLALLSVGFIAVREHREG